MDTFDELIQKAIDHINVNDLIGAESILKTAAAKDISAPQTHNLYGVISEYRGDILLAAKHYRAAYALDPTYRPAVKNLERITTFCSAPSDNFADFGANKSDEIYDQYKIEYDDRNIGRVVKKK